MDFEVYSPKIINYFTITDYQAKYFAYELTKRISSNSLEKLTSSLLDAQVDLNPHQIEAALFAFNSPLSKGCILADEVGLGKTIEAGLVLSQKWAERKRKILLIVPSSLRKQWNSELQEKFFLPSIILESKSFNQCVKDSNLNPFDQPETVVICSYHFARSKSPYIKQTKWNIAVIDEAHRLRNVYKTSSKIAREIKDALQGIPKILLTATPLQNSLLELYGLVSIVDEHVFGDLKSYKANYAQVPREQDIYENELGLVEPKQEMFFDLRSRLQKICTRTLRRQVLEYIKYTRRMPLTQDYIPTEQEIELYDGMSLYLQKPKLFALPFSQRQLVTLILRKLLASSSFAIASTLQNLSYKLTKLIEDAEKQQITEGIQVSDFEQNFENLEQLSDEWIDNEEDEPETKEENGIYSKEDIALMREERADLDRFSKLAKKIWKNSKGEALLAALEKGFEMASELGAKRKAIIFTESTITQNYLLRLLSEHGYKDKIVLFNGSNNDQKSKDVYRAWIERYKDTDKSTGSKTADMRAALIDYFKEAAEIMISTEAGAEGVNLQFCSLVINYDLPWNPQRIEQRIGRCHRYGQKYDVVVINFVNRKNAADRRVYELLDEKFNLFIDIWINNGTTATCSVILSAAKNPVSTMVLRGFLANAQNDTCPIIYLALNKGVFGASDEVLGNIESGVDFEKRIAAIYQTCRTEEEINSAFDELQREMDSTIQSGLKDARQKLLENFDAEVHEKLKTNLKESQSYLDTYERWLWNTTRHYLGDVGDFAEHEYSFFLKKNPFPGEDINSGPYKIGKNIEDAHIYRPGHPLAQRILNEIKGKILTESDVVFDYTNNPTIISVLQPLVGKSGTMRVSNFTAETFEAEDYIIVSAICENGEVVDQEIAKKIFSLSAKATPNISITSAHKQRLEDIEKEGINGIVVQIAQRNGVFFEREVDKLDMWADDMKKALELELRKLDIDIKTSKTNAKKIINLEEKLKAQRQIKDMEKRRNEMRRKLYEAQDEVDNKKERLLDRVEALLKQRTKLEPLFTVGWRVV